MRKTQSLKRIGLIASIILVVVTLSPLAVSANWFTTQLTDDSYADYLPQVSGNNVVWYGSDGSDNEIFFYNGSTVTTLTDNSYSDHDPQVSGNNVVWQGWPGGDSEIFLYDSSSTISTTLTDNSYNDEAPQISGNNVVWYGKGGGADNEIFLYDISSSITTTLTANSYNDQSPQISGNNVVWKGGPGAYEIFLYDSSSTITTTLTATSYSDDSPQISGNNVVWRGGPSSNAYEIFLYDISSTISTTLTDNNYRDQMPQVSGNNVVWYGSDGSDNEIFFYNGSTVTTLTANGYVDDNPQISGNNVVWEGGAGGGSEIYLAVLDTTAPTDPTISSSSHQVGQWKNDSTIDLKVHPDATDADSGVSGYSITFTKDTTEVPPQTICTTDTPNTTDTYTSPELTNGAHYANVSTVDKAGNWTSTVHMGPFKIDTAKPTASVRIKNGKAATKKTNVTLNISASDTGGSGLWWMRARNQEGEWSSWTEFSKTMPWTLPEGDGRKKVEVEIKDRAYNHSDIVSDTIILDTVAPRAYVRTPWISTNKSKTTKWEVRWFGVDKAPSSGIKNYTVKVKADNSSTWRFWKINTTKKKATFTGKPGRTYTFKALVKDNAYNQSTWSKRKTTVVPYDQDANVKARSGFSRLYSNPASNYYRGTARRSNTARHWIKYRVKGKSVHLIFKKGPNQSRAKIYIDGVYVKTIDTKSSSVKHRKAAFNKTWGSRGTHVVKIVNLATPGRARLDVDGIGIGR